MASAISAKLCGLRGVNKLTPARASTPASVPGSAGLSQNFIPTKDATGVVTNAAIAPCQVARFQNRPSRMITPRPLIVTDMNLTTNPTMLPAYSAMMVATRNAHANARRATTTGRFG